MRHEVDVTIVTECINLNRADRLLLKSGRQRILTEDQFARSFGIFDPSPDVIPRAEAHRRFEEIAVENRTVFERARAAPENCAGPISFVEGAVVHDRSRHALLIFARKERFQALQTRVRILPAPILPRFDCQMSGPGIEFPLVYLPAEFVWLATMEARDLNAGYAIGEANRHHVIRYMCRILLVVPQRRYWILECGSTMRVGGRAGRRITHRSKVKREKTLLAQL